jgi:hypothetical protein
VSKYSAFVVMAMGALQASCVEGPPCAPVVSTQWRHAVVDFDGDGRPDVITPGPGYFLFRGTSEGFEAPEAMLATDHYAGLAVGDVNGDGQGDLVTIGASNTQDGPGDFYIYVMLGGNTTFAVDKRFRFEVPCLNLMGLSDIDGDGHLDVVCESFLDEGAPGPSRSILVMHGNGAGDFGHPRVAGKISGCTWLAGASILTDLDGDGIDDVLFGCGQVAFLRGDGQGGFEQAWATEEAGWASAFAAGDFDGDGHVEVAAALFDHERRCVGGEGTVRIYSGGVERALDEFVQHRMGEDPVSLAVGDLDGDGDDDLAILHRVEQGGGMFVLLSNHGEARRLELPGHGIWVTADDIDGDGDLDIVVSTGRGLAVYTNDGAGNLAPPETHF